MVKEEGTGQLVMVGTVSRVLCPAHRITIKEITFTETANDYKSITKVSSSNLGALESTHLVMLAAVSFTIRSRSLETAMSKTSSTLLENFRDSIHNDMTTITIVQCIIILIRAYRNLVIETL